MVAPKNTNFIVSAAHDSTIRIWDLKLFTSFDSFKAHDNAISAMEFQENGNLLTVSMRENAAKIWDSDTLL